MTSTLDRYLGDFSASAPGVSPAQSKLVALGVAVAQEITNLLGSTLKADGVYGPATRNAWQTAATKRRLNPAFDRRNTGEAWVHPDTYHALAAEAYSKPAPKPAAKPAAKTVAKAAPGKPVAVAKPVAKAKPAARSAAPVPASAGTSDVAVLELQQILRGLGWTSQKLKVDGSYGPQTANAWMSSSKLRKLDGSIARIDGKTARVSSATHAALKTSKPATAATVSAAAVPTSAPAATASTASATSAPSGTSSVAVADLQRVLYGVGWTNKKLKADGLYGKQTAAAWAYSSKLRKLDPQISRIDGKTARVASATYAALSSAVAAPTPSAAALTPSAAAPAPSAAAVPQVAAPTSFVAQSVLAAQGILRALGWKKVAADGKFGPKTTAAWISSAKQRGLDPTFARVDGKTVRVSAGTFSQLQAAANMAPPAPPGTPEAAAAPSPEAVAAGAAPAQPSAVDQAFVRSFSAPVLVADVQKMLLASKKYPAVQVTGNWDAATQAAFLDAFVKEDTFRTAFTNALPQLLLQNGTSLLLLPDQAKVIALGASLYAQQQAATQQAPSSITATTQMPQLPSDAGVPSSVGPGMGPGAGPSPVPGMPGIYAGGGSSMPTAASYDTSSGGGITPVAVGTDTGAPGAPTDAAAAAPAAAASTDTWQSAVQTLSQLGPDAKKYADALEAAQKRGDLHPDVKAAVIAWGSSAEALKGHLAQVIDGSAPLKSAIEAEGPGAGLAGFPGFGLSHMALEARFGELSSFGVVAEKILDALKIPLQLTVGGKALSGLRGLRGLRGFNGLGIIEWVVQIGEVIWPKLIQLLGTRAVTVAGAAAMAASGANDIINADVKAYQDQNSTLAQMVSDGKLTVDEYNALKAQPPGGGASNVGLLIGGAVAIGALAVFLKTRKTGTAMAGSRRTA